MPVCCAAPCTCSTSPMVPHSHLSIGCWRLRACVRTPLWAKFGVGSCSCSTWGGGLCQSTQTSSGRFFLLLFLTPPTPPPPPSPSPPFSSCKNKLFAPGQPRHFCTAVRLGDPFKAAVSHVRWELTQQCDCEAAVESCQVAILPR